MEASVMSRQVSIWLLSYIGKLFRICPFLLSLQR